MVQYTLSAAAYGVPILHALKYPASEVLGLILGKQEGDDKNVTIETSIPLLHQWTVLTPMLEVALEQADLYATKRNLKISGLYYAGASSSGLTIPSHVTKIAEKIRNNSTFDTPILAIDNNKVKDDQLDTMLVPFLYKDNQWRAQRTTFGAVDATASVQSISFTLQDKQQSLNAIEAVLDKQGYDKLVDFDDHLEDVSLDWFSAETLISAK
ncbi:hypothetical protein BZG36_00789 [Bifiguratus adelaidae]|uniref:MPN domain-containing protein n=1 Tax=Bifiguratus adelaidae TaxID=1938954 RepID=A0A261Y6F3_9FUNG|nr:hypothetical protein BZG36_00789 [Bifiguratus adelaidae]